jgi:hypothetical protein
MKVWVEGQESIALHEDIIRLNQENIELRDEVRKWQEISMKMTEMAERLANLLLDSVEEAHELR